MLFQLLLPHGPTMPRAEDCRARARYKYLQSAEDTVCDHGTKYCKPDSAVFPSEASS